MRTTACCCVKRWSVCSSHPLGAGLVFLTSCRLRFVPLLRKKKSSSASHTDLQCFDAQVTAQTTSCLVDTESRRVSTRTTGVTTSGIVPSMAATNATVASVFSRTFGQ